MKQSRYNHIVHINGKDFLFNSFSRKTILLNTQVWDCLYSSAKDADCERLLKEMGYLVDDDINEAKIVENLFVKRKFSNRTYQLTINASLNCNLGCWYCYETHLPKSNMTMDLAHRILLHVENQAIVEKYELLHLTFFGGEPLLNIKTVIYIVEEVVKLSTKYGFKVLYTFVTNGTLITSKFREIIKDQNVTFQITFDGIKEKHNSVRKFKANNETGSYDMIIGNLQKLREDCPKANFIVRINYDELTLKNISELLNDLSFLSPQLSCYSLARVWQCRHFEKEEELLFSAINSINERGYLVNSFRFQNKYECCYADNYNQAVINYNGSVFKCTARDFKDKSSFGILDKHGLIEWNIAELNKRLMLAMPVECKECSLLPCCPGICSQKRLEKTPFECVLNVTTKENIILFNIKQDAIQKRITNRNE